MTVHPIFIGQDDNRIEPSNNKVDVGTDTKFTCNSGGPIIWYYSDTKNEPIALPTSQKELKLTSVRFESAGYYICYGQYRFDLFGMINEFGMFLSRSTLEVFRMFVNVIMS